MTTTEKHQQLVTAVSKTPQDLNQAFASFVHKLLVGVTILLVALLLGLALWILRLRFTVAFFHWEVDTGGAMRPMFGLGLIGAALAILRMQLPQLVKFGEVWLHKDLDRDGWIGEPRFVMLQAPPPGPPPDDLRERTAQFVTDGERLEDVSEDRWVGAHKLLTQQEYDAVRDNLIRLGWAAWRNPQERRQGWHLVRPAAEIVASIH